MQTAETLKRKISTAQDLLSVVKTMKALAAASIRQYERAVESLADYYLTIELGLRALVKTETGGAACSEKEPSASLWRFS